MSCEDALILISGHLDSANSPLEEVQLQEHLAVCANCRALLSQWEAADEALRALRTEVPAGLKEDIMAAIDRERKPSWKRSHWKGLAVAAALTVVIGVGALVGLPSQEEAGLQGGYGVRMALETPQVMADVAVFSAMPQDLLGPQELADQLCAPVAVLQEAPPSLRNQEYEVLEDGSWLYTLEDAEGAAELSQGQNGTLFLPAEAGIGTGSYVLILPE